MGLRRLAVVAIAAVLATLLPVPVASADATADLKSAVVAKRGKCPALQNDPILDQVAERADRETQNYAQMIARFQPMEDPMPTLKTLNYPAGKAKLLSGFSETTQPNPQERANYGAVLFGWEAIPDCSYTSYGAHAMTNDATGYATAAIVLVGD